MLGTNARLFRPLPTVTLEQLVPADHYYRSVDRVLDLSFVRALVRETYAADAGRPSIDPVVFFTLQLVMFFEGIRSERQLLRLATDRLSVRWYLGYNLDEHLPDHSSLTRIRMRYGVEIFRQFFDAIVAQRQEAGLVWVVSSTLTPPKCRLTLRSARSPRVLLSKRARRCIRDHQ
jgi:transposase